MQPLARIFIIRFVVRLIVINSDLLHFRSVIGSFILNFGFLIEFRLLRKLHLYFECGILFNDLLSLGGFLLIFIELWILVTHVVIIIKWERTLHQTFVLCRNLFWRRSVDYIRIVADTNEDRA